MAPGCPIPGVAPGWLPGSLLALAILAGLHRPEVLPVPLVHVGARSVSSIPTPGTAARRLPIRDEYHRTVDLRGFVERHRPRVADPETAFYVSQALEDCAAAGHVARDDAFPLQEREAAALLASHCTGFPAGSIEPRAILELVGYAARWGEPRALARMLLFRDIAAPKDDVLAELPWMLASGDPSVVRDVGAFLSRGEAEWRYGEEHVATAVAAIAWELAACDLDPDCRPWTRFGLSQCALLGRCARGSYEEALASVEPPELMRQARALRAGILRALRDHDWGWLGLR